MTLNKVGKFIASHSPSQMRLIKLHQDSDTLGIGTARTETDIPSLSLLAWPVIFFLP